MVWTIGHFKRKDDDYDDRVKNLEVEGARQRGKR